jgi:hypothetical protein
MQIAAVVAVRYIFKGMGSVLVRAIPKSDTKH